MDMIDAQLPYRSAGLAPYREPVAQDTRTAPSLAWTRIPAVIIGLLGSISAGGAIVDLFTNTGCEERPRSPHIAMAFLMLAIVLTQTALGVLVRRRLGALIRARVRVRSRLASAAFGVAIILPIAIVAALDFFEGLYFYFNYLFHICGDFSGVFSFGC